MTENEISYQVRGSIFDVYNYFGPGLLESVYAAALHEELTGKNLQVESEVAIPVWYHEKKLDIGFRLDLWVEKKVIIEVKSVESLLPVHHKQVLTYLRLCSNKLGILVNFNVDDIASSIFRKVVGL
jgi:GxxExxY protein